MSLCYLAPLTNTASRVGHHALEHLTAPCSLTGDRLSLILDVNSPAPSGSRVKSGTGSKIIAFAGFNPNFSGQEGTHTLELRLAFADFCASVDSGQTFLVGR